MYYGSVISFWFRKMRTNFEEMLYSETGSTGPPASKSITPFSPENREGPAQPRALEAEAASLLPFKFSAELRKPEFFLISFLDNN